MCLTGLIPCELESEIPDPKSQAEQWLNHARNAEFPENRRRFAGICRNYLKDGGLSPEDIGSAKEEFVKLESFEPKEWEAIFTSKP